SRAVGPCPLAHQLVCCLLIPSPPRASLFPYTTLFRSPDTWYDFLRVFPLLLPLFQNPVNLCDLFLHSEKTLYQMQLLLIAFQCLDRKSTRLNSSHVSTSYAVFCLKNNTEAHDA